MVDQDYVSKLSPTEKEWLAAFNDAWVGGDFRRVPKSKWPKAARSVVNMSKNAGRVDVTTNGTAVEGVRLEQRIADLEADWSETPEYLDSTEYKQALAEYRRTLNPSRKNLKPKVTPEFETAARRLKRLTPTTEEEINEYETKHWRRLAAAGRKKDD